MGGCRGVMACSIGGSPRPCLLGDQVWTWILTSLVVSSLTRGMTCQYQNSYGTIAAGGGISQTAFACQKSRHFLQGNKILSAAIRRVQIPS